MTTTLLDIAIQKGSSVPVHRQLVMQLSIQIAAGTLTAGTKLPSVRGLSQRLGIHYNTCLTAYRELESLGLIEIKQGSGVKVRTFDNDPNKALQKLTPERLKHLELSQMARFFANQVLQRGYTWPEIIASLEEIRTEDNNKKYQTVVMVDKHPDILPVFQTELQQGMAGVCPNPVEVMALDDVSPDAYEPDTCYVTSRYYYQQLVTQLGGHEEDIVMVNVASGQQEKGFIKNLKPGDLVLVASASISILQQAEAVLTALRGDELLLRTISLDEPRQELDNAAKHAKLIIADSVATPVLETLTSKVIHTLRVLPADELGKIRARLL